MTSKDRIGYSHLILTISASRGRKNTVKTELPNQQAPRCFLGTAILESRNEITNICQHQVQTLTKCWQINLCTAWSRANWIRYCLHLIFPWPCRPSQAPWLASEPGFDSHWFCLERAKTGKLRHRKNELGHREQPAVVGSVGVIVFSHSALCSNSRPRNKTPTGRTKVIPTEFNWLLIKHIMRGASRPSSQTLFSWQTTHSQRAHHLQGVTLPLYIFPLSHRCCKDEHEIIQRLWVSFWVEKTWVYGHLTRQADTLTPEIQIVWPLSQNHICGVWTWSQTTTSMYNSNSLLTAFKVVSNPSNSKWWSWWEVPAEPPWVSDFNLTWSILPSPINKLENALLLFPQQWTIWFSSPCWHLIPTNKTYTSAGFPTKMSGK